MKTVFCRMMNHARFTAMNVSSINPHQSHFSFLQEQEIADIMNEVLLLSFHDATGVGSGEWRELF